MQLLSKKAIRSNLLQEELGNRQSEVVRRLVLHVHQHYQIEVESRWAKNRSWKIKLYGSSLSADLI